VGVCPDQEPGNPANQRLRNRDAIDAVHEVEGVDEGNEPEHTAESQEIAPRHRTVQLVEQKQACEPSRNKLNAESVDSANANEVFEQT